MSSAAIDAHFFVLAHERERAATLKTLRQRLHCAQAEKDAALARCEAQAQRLHALETDLAAIDSTYHRELARLTACHAEELTGLTEQARMAHETREAAAARTAFQIRALTRERDALLAQLAVAGERLRAAPRAPVATTPPVADEEPPWHETVCTVLRTIECHLRHIRQLGPDPGPQGQQG